MRITAKILNIPPYISTSWTEVTSLHTRADALGQLLLIIQLRQSTSVEIPNLGPETIQAIFDTFSRYLEQEKVSIKTPFDPIHFSLPLKKGMPSDSFGLAMQHDPEKGNLPNLPPEMLQKIAHIAKAFGLEDSSVLPKPEPHCNCVHCQVLRTLHKDIPEPMPVEEEISEEDLKFRNWDIQQTADKLYIVSNPLDPVEQYTVFLGEPLDCTCGNRNCEHIRAVLSS